MTKNRRSLRVVLTSSILVILTVSLGALSLLLTQTLWQSLEAQLDHHVHLVLMQAEEAAASPMPEERAFLLNTIVKMEGMTVLLLDDKEDVISQLNSENVAPLSDQQIKAVIAESLHADQPHRHRTMFGQRFGALWTQTKPPQIILVGSSAQLLETSYQQALLLITLSFTLTLLVCAASIWWLLNHFLKPVETIAAFGESVQHPRQLTDRYRGSTLTSELDRIAETYNNLLDRLATIFQQEHEFFSAAAHTLKTPLAVLRTDIESQLELKSRHRQRLLGVIDEAVTTVNDLLLISRLETTGRQQASTSEVNLSQLVVQSVEIATTLGAEKQLSIDASIAKRLCVRGNRQLLQRAINNLIDNAVRYAPTQSEINVSLTKSNSPQGSESEEPAIILTVANASPQLKPADLERLFDRFYRGKNAAGTLGSGLGLAIARSVIEQAGGTIHARLSDETHETLKITVRLPALLQSDYGSSRASRRQHH